MKSVASRWSLISCFILAGLGYSQKEVQNKNLKPPAEALAAGYVRLVFDEEFEDGSGIDLKNTGGTGFHFYLTSPWGNQADPAFVRVHDGVLELGRPLNAPDKKNHAALFSAISNPAKGEAQKYRGFAIGRGAYFEARIRFDPDFLKKNPGAKGFPNFYSNPVEHHFDPPAMPYQYLEMDHMEYFPGWYRNATNYFNALIKWDAFVNSNGTQYKTDFVDSNYEHRQVQTPPGSDMSAFNVYGALWIPGTNGRADSFFNGQCRRSLSQRDYPKLAVGDSLHFMVILGCDQWPIEVDWVRVWASGE
ncbi:MAG: hypothetical protein JNM63_01795 [Spirochaetia bacterium]|nr:hypothetical protein [Spirochaetia bacterium]